MVLPYINMNPPQVYRCFPSWTPLPPPSLYHPSGSSQCTSPKHPVSIPTVCGSIKLNRHSTARCFKQFHWGCHYWVRKMWSEQWGESHSVMSDSLWPHGLYCPWISPGQNTGMDNLSFLQGIFPTWGLNPGLPHCRQILYQQSHRGSPRILEWVAYPFSRGSSWLRNQTRVSCIAGGFFTNWVVRGR